MIKKSEKIKFGEEEIKFETCICPQNSLSLQRELRNENETLCYEDETLRYENQTLRYEDENEDAPVPPA